MTLPPWTLPRLTRRLTLRSASCLPALALPDHLPTPRAPPRDRCMGTALSCRRVCPASDRVTTCSSLSPSPPAELHVPARVTLASRPPSLAPPPRPLSWGPPPSRDEVPRCLGQKPLPPPSPPPSLAPNLPSPRTTISCGPTERPAPPPSHTSTFLAGREPPSHPFSSTSDLSWAWSIQSWI